jgi:hypothetical protein
MAKVPGKGTTLAHGVSATFTTIAQRASIDGPDAKVGTANTTDLDSAAAEYRPTLPDGGELSMQIWWDPAIPTHQLLTSLWTTPTVESWKLTFANATPSVCPFSAILTGFKAGGMTPDGYLTADIKMQVTGLITWPSA